MKEVAGKNVTKIYLKTYLKKHRENCRENILEKMRREIYETYLVQTGPDTTIGNLKTFYIKTIFLVTLQTRQA